MKSAPTAVILVLWAIHCPSGLGAEGHPFPVIEDVPERNLIGADGHGHPRIDDGNKGKVARLAASGDTPEKLRFYAIWGLAISGYSPESAEGLMQAAEDKNLGAAARGYAATGLGNFSTMLPTGLKEALRTRLRRIVVSESAMVPDAIIRTLMAWGDAEWVADSLGDRMHGHPMEIAILSGLGADRATDRLLELFEAEESRSIRESYNRRAEIGKALLGFQDKRGIDILEPLLDADAVPLGGGIQVHQYRYNVFHVLARAVGQDFGYGHSNHDPSLDEAIGRLRSWWRGNRQTFTFPGSGRPAGTAPAGRSPSDGPQPGAGPKPDGDAPVFYEAE